MSKTKYSGLPDTTEIEVIMRKKMTLQKYQEIKESNHKGWQIQGYQLNTYSEPIKEKV